MAELFNTLPPTLFNPLAARGAPVYADVLLRVFAATQSSYQPLSREAAMYVVAQALRDPAALELTSDADADAANDDAETDVAQARAGAILRYLTRCGWLRSEMQRDFAQTYILPDYAFRLLAVLAEIARSEPPALRGLIYSIYALLKTALDEHTLHIGLGEAHRQTLQLVNGLKELQHNIGGHIEQVLRQHEARAVLEQLFVNYRDEIVDRAYHQLRTTDHVSRFRPGVLQALAQIAADGQIEAVAQRMYQNHEAPSIDDAATRAIDAVRDIREHFDTLDRFLETIDARHSQFVDAAIRNVELRLTASSTTSGQLHTILAHLLAQPGASNQTLPSEYAPLLDLFRLELMDSASLSPPTRAAVPFTPEPVAAPVLSAQAINAAREDTLRQLNRAISRERVRRFASDLLTGRDQVVGADIPLRTPDDLPLLMYLRVYGDGSLGYRVDDVPDGGWIAHGALGFRDFVLRRVVD